MSQNLRRATRRALSNQVQVLDTMTERAIGHISNLSESGMLLIASEPVTDEALYQLRFNLPGHHGEGGTAVNVGTHLLWSAPANTPGQTWAGLRFLTIDKAALDAVREWVDAESPPA